MLFLWVCVLGSLDRQGFVSMASLLSLKSVVFKLKALLKIGVLISIPCQSGFNHFVIFFTGGLPGFYQRRITLLVAFFIRETKNVCEENFKRGIPYH